MVKNITVTSIDGVNISDKSNMESNSGKKTKMFHEQAFEHYGVDPKKVFERTGLLKTIPLEWISEIIISNINNCKTPRSYQNINQEDRSITIGFETIDLCKKFYGDPYNNIPSEFNNNMIKSINDFLTHKSKDPKQYNRIIVIESVSDGLQVTIRY